MKLYHGSDMAVEQPLAKVGRLISQKAIDGYLKFEKSTIINAKED